jgi:hypothetical protein
MAAGMGKAALAALMIGCVPALGADAISKFCKPGAAPTDKTVLDYQVEPSMVVHDDTLDITFAQAGMANETGGSVDDSLFSFSRTIDSILRSARVINENTPADARQAARVAFVQTMIDSFDNDGKVMLNPKSGVLVPVDDRRDDSGGGAAGEGSLSPADLLDASNPEFGMQPRALFNRFDLAPADWSHCGEYRAVYSIPNGGIKKRFFLIFEAMVPNPYFAGSDTEEKRLAAEAGCRPISEFWAGLSSLEGDAAAQRLKRATQLSELYYRGVEGVTSKQGAGPANPVLSFRNLGGDKGRGQVRANVFFQGDWQLREWLTQLTSTGLAFVPETVKDNPIAELYTDDLSGTALAGNNIPGVLQSLHGDFVTHFMTTVQDNLLVERSDKYRLLAGEIEKYSVTKSDDATPIDEDDLLVTVVGLQSDDRFNEFQSVSNPPNAQTLSDAPSELTGAIFRKTLEFLNAHRKTKDRKLETESAEILINRAEAGTCAGCHQSSPRNGTDFVPATVKAAGIKGTPVMWPDVVKVGPGFVHVSETRELSEALKDHFLPVRKLIMGTELCKALPEPAEGAGIMSVDVAAAAYSIDNTIAAFASAQGNVGTMNVGGPEPALDMFNALPVEDKAVLTEKLADEIGAERDAEQKMPGAFVESRRPH